jgi:hypothetical protein
MEVWGVALISLEAADRIVKNKKEIFLRIFILGYFTIVYLIMLSIYQKTYKSQVAMLSRIEAGSAFCSNFVSMLGLNIKTANVTPHPVN